MLRAATKTVGGKGLPPYDLGVYGLGGWNGHNRRRSATLCRLVRNISYSVILGHHIGFGNHICISAVNIITVEARL